MRAGAREYSISGRRVTLRTLKPEDVTDSYVRWLNDPDVTRYISVHGIPQDMASVLQYVRGHLESDTKVLLGIFVNEGDCHIGNVTFPTLGNERGIGYVGISVGEKAFWGRGYGVEALELTKQLAFEHMGLHHLRAGVKRQNKRSMRLFARAGFRIEEVRVDQGEAENALCGVALFGLWREELPP